MPRDAGGNYTLPAGNPVVTGTVITSSWANPTMADIANEITNSLSRNGQGGMLVPFEFFDGIENAPGITFTLEPTAGMYRPGNGLVGIASQGVTIGLFKAASGQIEVEGAEPLVPGDLTRKDYVDDLVADSIAAIFDALHPVGSFKVGGDPNGIIPGTWTQLAEGTFLMNTVAGSDPAGGSNNSDLQQHSHSIDHNHPDPTTSTEPDHQHVGPTGTNANEDGSWDKAGNNAGITDQNVQPAGEHNHSVVIPNFVGTSGNAGSGAGVNENKPLYKGVEVWERTA